MQLRNSFKFIRIVAMLFFGILVTGCHKDAENTAEPTPNYTSGLSGAKVCSGRVQSMLRDEIEDSNGLSHSIYPVIDRNFKDSSLVLTAVNDTVISFANGQLYFSEIDSAAKFIVFSRTFDGPEQNYATLTYHYTSDSVNYDYKATHMDHDSYTMEFSGN